MFRVLKSPLSLRTITKRFFSKNNPVANQFLDLPQNADVIIIGGGSAGCNTLYQLAKRNVKAVLLERAKLTSGTTWHTAGMTRGLQASDVDIILLNRTMEILRNLENETEIDPGWINNGGLFVTQSEEREKDFLRQMSLGKCFNVQSELLDANEATKIFPLLNPKSFNCALYCPGDGNVDPAMLCNALKKYSLDKGAKIFEHCPVIYIQTEQTKSGHSSVTGVVTPHGTIKTKCIINCTGVWSRDLAQMVDLELPLIPLRHAYVVSNSMNGVRGMPNVRDLDASIYVRIQGESICLGGYEANPDFIQEVPSDFHFSLYDLNWDTFEEHMKGAVNILPAFGKAGIKTTVCGPESFTPDHKPLMGEDPRLNGLFHNCGFNSSGMMLGGGCAEQIALWVLNGRPDLPMYTYDIRRFTPKMIKNKDWVVERCHEAYAKNYNIQYCLDESLAGRNLVKSPFHDDLVSKGAFMEQKLGWERPRYFRKDGSVVIPDKYRWYGAYGNEASKSLYEKELENDCTFSYPPSHEIVREEALTCRNKAVLFDLSYYCKLYLSGKDKQKAMDWLFSGNTNQKHNKIIYTCGLNEKGGVETDVTITSLDNYPFANGHFCEKDPGFYIVAGGVSAYQTWTHLNNHLQKANFNVQLKDITKEVGVLSIQGPHSKEIIRSLSEKVVKEDLPLYRARIIEIDGHKCLLMRISFVGELGYELHIPKTSCQAVYRKIVEEGHNHGMKHAGFRALYSLSLEKGYHLWNLDLRSNDSPIEANLGFTCRKNGNYIGKNEVDKLRSTGVKKMIAYFTLNCEYPIWGFETIWRNKELVGFLRRGDYAYHLDCNMGVGYVQHPKSEIMTDEYLLSGDYELEIMGKRYEAKIHKRSPFDPENLRMLDDTRIEAARMETESHVTRED